jgi:O-antigen/teichoic acid export membrane protein
MASALILLPFYIELLPVEVYGAFSLCLAFSVLVQIIVTYSFDTSLYIHYHEYKNNPSKLSSFITSAFVFMLFLGAGVLLLSSVAGELLFTLFPSESKLSFYPYGLISVGIGVCQAIFKVHGNLLQTREKPEPFLWSNVFQFSVIAITTIIGLQLFPGSLIGPLGGRLLAAALSGSWALWRVFKEFGFRIESPWKDSSFGFNAYTFAYQLQQWSNNYIDRYIILLFLPMSSVGIYDFAIKCLIPIELLMNGLNASINPKVIQLVNGQSVKGSSLEINRYYYGLVAVVLLTICFVVLAVPLFVNQFMTDSKYADALEYIPYLSVLYVFKAVRLYFVSPFSILKKMRKLMSLNLVISIIKIGLLIWLIAEWQLFGIVVASLLTFSIELPLLWKYLKEDYQIQFNVFKLMIAPFLVLLLILISNPFVAEKFDTWVHAGYLLFSGLLLLTAYRNELKLLITTKLVR